MTERRASRCAGGAILALAAAAACSGPASGPASSPAGATPPAAQAPHPLPERDGPKRPVDYTKPPLADNSRCYVCHLNYEEDPFVRWHAWGGVGCEKCHGPSDDHCGDENHETAPDILFSKESMPPACWECHPEVKPPRGYKPAVAADAAKACTECHGRHRLPERLRRWDKKTRKLIE